MEIHFLGAANTVTGSQFLLLTDQARVLIDCGMFQGGPHEVVRNRVPVAYDPASLDAIVLTHAHLDHCGLIPHVVAEGFTGPIYATRGTIELASLVLLDSGKLQEEFAKRQRHWAARNPDKAAREEQRDEAEIEAQEQIAEQEEEAPAESASTGAPIGSRTGAATGLPGARTGLPAGAPPGSHVGDVTPDGHVIASGIDELALRDEQGVGTRMGLPPFGHPDHEAAMAGSPAHPNLVLEEPVYNLAQAQASLSHFRATDYETPLAVAPGITAVYHDAGHILGSAIVELHVAAQKDVPARTLVFSGDLGRTGAPILRDPTVVPRADYVFVESTYGGRVHEPEDDSLTELEQAVKDVIAQSGVLLIPAFAIGRTQEIVWALRHLLDAGRIPPVKLYLDSPMASKASTIYREHRDYYDADTLALLGKGEGPIDFPNQQETPLPAQSELIERSRRPYILVASNGMLTGGRVLNHLRSLIGDSKAIILFVGYQGEATLGAHLQAGVKTARISGQEYTVRCAIRSISGFSAHADEPGLLAWLGNFITGRKAGDKGVPRRVFIVHGDPDAQVAIEPKISALGLPSMAPHWHQHVVLD
ncbi:MAG: MBL fold metallo-hydrolase [Candidatus Limnocylindrales bacterium]|jgi:metallo-beta-lactamase family protein